MLDKDTSGTTAHLIHHLATTAAEPKSVDRATFIIEPPGHKLVDASPMVEARRMEPSRIKGNNQLQSLQSLITLVRDRIAAAPQPSAYLYADPANASFAAVFNDTRGGNRGWRDDIASYKAEYTPEFRKWLGANANKMSQTEFAEFIEDNIADISNDGETLLRVATTIQASTGINFSSAKRLDNGQNQLTYVENIEATAGGGSITIPRVFKIGLRLFANNPQGYNITARLKYRLHAGGVSFWYELDRPERAIEDAINGYIKLLSEQVPEIPVLIGKP